MKFPIGTQVKVTNFNDPGGMTILGYMTLGTHLTILDTFDPSNLPNRYQCKDQYNNEAWYLEHWLQPATRIRRH